MGPFIFFLSIIAMFIAIGGTVMIADKFVAGGWVLFGCAATMLGLTAYAAESQNTHTETSTWQEAVCMFTCDQNCDVFYKVEDDRCLCENSWHEPLYDLER